MSKEEFIRAHMKAMLREAYFITYDNLEGLTGDPYYNKETGEFEEELDTFIVTIWPHLQRLPLGEIIDHHDLAIENHPTVTETLRSFNYRSVPSNGNYWVFRRNRYHAVDMLLVRSRFSFPKWSPWETMEVFETRFEHLDLASEMFWFKNHGYFKVTGVSKMKWVPEKSQFHHSIEFVNDLEDLNHQYKYLQCKKQIYDCVLKEINKY
jgi:hypothetical protein